MDTFDTLIVVVASFIVGMFYGQFKQSVRFLTKIGSDPEHFINLLTKIKAENDREQLEEELGAPADGVELRVEVHNNIYYCYRKDTEQFVGQGTDLEELIKEVHTKTGLNVWAKMPEQSNQSAC